MPDMESLYGETKSRSRRNAAGRVLAVFMLVMVSLTIANRALNEMTMPAVAEAKVQRGALEKRIDADGQIQAAAEVPVFSPVGARVSAVHVRSGQQVEKGGALFTLDQDALTELAATAERELAKLTNDREKAAGSHDGIPDDAGVQSASLALTRAKDDLSAKRAEQDRAVALKQSDLDAAKAKRAEAQSAYEVAKAHAYAEYLNEKEDDRDKASKTLEDKRQAFDWAAAGASKWMLDKYADCQEDVSKAQAQYDAALAAQEKAQRTRDQAMGTAGESTAAKALKEATDRTKDAKDELDKAIRNRDRLGVHDYLSALRDLSRAQEDYALSDAAYQAALLKTADVSYEIEQKCDAQKSALDTAESDIEEKTKALETAEVDRDSALTKAERDVEDAETALTKAQGELRQKQLDVANADADIAKKQAELDRLSQALADGGVVSSPVSGQITACDLKPGKSASTDEAALLIGKLDEGLALRIPVSDDEAKLVTVGDSADIELGGSTYSCKVLSISPSADDPGMFELTFNLPRGAGQAGMTASMTFTKRTKNYDAIVPLNTLRKDDTGYYVYAIVTADGALGSETKIERADVQVLDKDSTRAAITGGMTQRDRLAARSDRELHDGDRVNIE